MKGFNRLTALEVETLPPRRAPYTDGSHLYLFVNDGGTRRWAFIYTSDKVRREIKLGAAGKQGLSLRDARAKTRELNVLLDQGLDPAKSVREQSARRRDCRPSGKPPPLTSPSANRNGRATAMRTIGAAP